MARPPQHADGAYGAPDVTQESGGFPGPPNVYHPRAGSTPAYEEYADPAAAHGWQNAYDQTRELPSVAADVPAVVRGSEPGRRGTRRKPAVRRSRRALVAVGAVGVSAAALIAGFSFSVSSPDGARNPGGARSVPDEPTGSAGAASPADPPAPLEAPVAGATAGGASAGADASRGPAAATQTGAPSPPSPTSSTGLSAAPSASASVVTAPAVTVSGPGNSDGKGHGRGATKGPK